jgi:hypothetical protein
MKKQFALIEKKSMDSRAIAEPVRPGKGKPWRLWTATVATLIMGFFVAFELGQFRVDRTQSTSSMMWFGFLFPLVWLIKACFKCKLSAAKRALVSCMGAAVLAALGYAGFRAGEAAAYSPDAKRVVGDIQLHLKRIKAVKIAISSQRQSMRDPAELLKLESNIEGVSNEVTEVEELLDKVSLMSKPEFISGILDLVRKGLSFDKWELENLNKQIAILKSVQNESATARAVAYRKELIPLIEQEEKIDRERTSFDLPEHLKQVAAQSGFDASEGDRLAAAAVRGGQ